MAIGGKTMDTYDPYKSESEKEKNSILLNLWQSFPDVMSAQELKRRTNIEEDRLNQHLTYLEDKGLIKKEDGKFRITAQGIDYRKEKSKLSGFETVET